MMTLCLPLAGWAQTSSSLQEMVNRKQYAAVLEHAARLTPEDSADYQTMNAVAQAYEGMLKYREAYSCFRLCLAMDTSNTDVLNSLARMATNLGKASDAERYYTRVLEADSTDFYANFQLGRLYYQLGNYAKAADKYEYLLQSDEQNPTLLRNAGDCHLKAGDILPAIGAYFLAYEHNKENAGLASTLVNTLLLYAPEMADVVQICDTALYYNPGNRLIRQNKAMALFQKKQYTAADTIYSELLAEGDSSLLTIRYGGFSAYNAGQYLRSVELLEIAHKQDTASVDVCLFYGSALGKTYDRKLAYTILDEAEKNMQPKEGHVDLLTLYRGETLQRDGRLDEAARHYYTLWKKTGKLSLLGTISNFYSPFNISQYKDEAMKQKSIFINVLYIKEFLKSGEDTKNMFYKRNLLESYLEDMFFRSIKEETMIAPDGKKTKIKDEEIRELANRLPEMPEKVRQDIQNSQKEMERLRKEREKQRKDTVAQAL